MDLRRVEPQKGSIELLAFLLMVKNAHSNSVLYEAAAYKMAAKIGLSDGRLVKKYLTKCIVMGLCSVDEQCFNTNGRRTVYKFISYREALATLIGVKSAQLKYFPLHRNLGKFKSYQYQIELDLAGMNYSQQAYKTASNFPDKNNIIKEMTSLYKLPVPEKQTRKVRSKLKRLGKKYSTADTKIQESYFKKHADGVVTGCNHIAKLIGKTSTTAFKRIKKWQEQGNMQVHDIVYFQPTSSLHEASLLIETLLRDKVKGIHVYSKKEKGIKTIAGKKVLGFSSAAYQYGTLCNDNSSLTFSK